MIRKCTTVLILIAAGLAWVGPSHAACKNARIVSTLFPRGSYSYIHTPGVAPTPTSSSITDDFEGFFWALGAGGPEFQQGHDNGAFVALGPGREGWLQHPVGYAATFHTTWGAGRHIDGCIDQVGIKTTCTTVMLLDQHEGTGYFALLTAAPVQGNYSFVQPENGPIVLAPVPAPQVIDVRATSSEVRATIRVGEMSSGLFLSEGCPTDIVQGYRIYVQVVRQGGDAPTDRGLASSGRSGAWVLETDGGSEGDGALALAAPAQVTIACNPGDEVYLATSLVFDSGFETKYVSESSAPIRCSD